MTLLIVEDEELAAEKLVTTVMLVEKDAIITGITGSIKATVDWLNNHQQPDVILMDIELSDGQSFEVFNQADVMSAVIFTTSYDEYALKAFKVNSIDYLLKPVQKEELRKAFGKYKRLHSSAKTDGAIQAFVEQMRQQLQPKQYRERFLVKLAQKQIPIEVQDIAFFFILNRITFFKTFDNRKFIIDYNLDELDQSLNPSRFFRINRSCILSIKSVLQIHDYFNNRLILSLHPAAEDAVIISRDKVNDFKKWIGK